MPPSRRKPTARTARAAPAAASQRRTTPRRTTRRPSTSLYPRRRASRPGLPTTIGTAIGTLVVATLLDASWPVRIGLVALALVLGLAYVVWRARRDDDAAQRHTGPESTAAEGDTPS